MIGCFGSGKAGWGKNALDRKPFLGRILMFQKRKKKIYIDIGKTRKFKMVLLHV